MRWCPTLANDHMSRRPPVTEVTEHWNVPSFRNLMIQLISSDEGILLPVHAQPNARQDGIVGIHDGRLKVAVTESPEKGKANKQFTRVLASALGLKRSQIVLVKGHTSSTKTFAIKGVSCPELHARIADLLDD